MPRTESEARMNGMATNFEERILAMRESVDAAAAAAKEAVSKAESSTEKRFEALTEFRAHVGEQTKTFISRQEFDTLRNGYSERLRDLSSRMDRNEGKGDGLNAGWVYLLGGLGAVGTVISIMVIFFID